MLICHVYSVPDTLRVPQFHRLPNVKGEAIRRDQPGSQLARVATGHLGLEASVELADRELQRAEEGGDEPAAG